MCPMCMTSHLVDNGDGFMVCARENQARPICPFKTRVTLPKKEEVKDEAVLSN